MAKCSAPPSQPGARRGCLVVLRDVQELYGFHPRVLRGRGRSRLLCRARAHAYCQLRDEGYTFGQIAGYMGERSRSTVRQSERGYRPKYATRRELHKFSRAELIEIVTERRSEPLLLAPDVKIALEVRQSEAILLTVLALEYPKTATKSQVIAMYDEVAANLGHGNGEGVSGDWLRQMRCRISRNAQEKAWPKPFADIGNCVHRLSDSFAALMREKVGRPHDIH